MYTLSGASIELGHIDRATFKDIATGLSRLPRWAGNTRVPFSVLQHSLMVHDMVSEQEFVGPTNRLRLLALWHDAHEFATGDICPPFKTPEQQAIQRKIDEELWVMLDTSPLRGWETEAIKRYDKRAVSTEAWTICHDKVREYFPEPTEKDSNLLLHYVDMPEFYCVKMFLDLTEDYRQVDADSTRYCVAPKGTKPTAATGTARKRAV